MFTTDQIRNAHSKVRSGADFPAYIQELKQLGVASYQTFVADGHTDFEGENDFRLGLPAKYENLAIAENCDPESFSKGLKDHQQGKTDYLSFIALCADCGIEKWKVDIAALRCTYFDRSGHEILTESIPG